MGSKKFIKYQVKDVQNNYETFIPVGILEGSKPGPTLAVIGGVHGTEYCAHEGVQRFWNSLDPDELSGKVFVILAADVTAMCSHSLYTNPIDGKNLNRVWPGKKDGTLTEVIAYTITQEIILKSDAVIDCHAGEYDEYIDLFIITHFSGDETLDNRTLNLAMALGMPFVEVTDANGSVLGAGTGSGEAVRSGRPGLTLEAGGRGLQEERSINGTFLALQNAIKSMGIKAGQPALWAGQPIKLDHGVLLKTTAEGLYVPEVTIGGWIEEGDVFVRILDFDGALLEEIRAPETGVVMDVINARAIKAGGFAGKIGVI